MDKGDVSRTLCGLGLLPSSVCYFYMAEALRLSLREPDRLLLVTKHVYPDVARCFDTNWKCVERGLRRPSLMLAMKLADALGCTLTELVGPESA